MIQKSANISAEPAASKTECKYFEGVIATLVPTYLALYGCTGKWKAIERKEARIYVTMAVIK